MGARVKALVSSLGFRLLVPLFLIVAGVLAVHAFFSFRSAEENFLRLVGGEADRSSGLIRRATHDGMLLNRLDEVQATIQRLAEGPEVAAIRVYDKKGTIVLSSDRTELGRRIPLDDAPCSNCHPAAGPVSAALLQATDLATVDGEETLRTLSVIDNEAACSQGSCHGDATGQSVLGVLDVEMSMQPLEAALASSRRRVVWTTLALILVIGLVAAVVYRRLVHQPIARLQEGARSIAGGDLTTRIHVPGEHELALLARDFNRMAVDLSRTQGELTEWSQKLEEKVEAKTGELRDAQRQVLHMEKMASLGKLSATVAHELNNPLSGVLTYARLVERELEEQPLDAGVRDELRRYLHLVQQECARCGDIVQNLLLFSRRNGSDMCEVDLNEVVERSLMLVRHHLEISGVTLRTERLEEGATVVADPDQLRQALVALFVNAAEAMGESGGELSVTLVGDDEQVRIDVGDTGVGIAPEALPLIFEPFFSTKEGSGVGLGLAVVYGIVHRHGGSLEVESEQGVGTVFHLHLPRIPPDQDEDVELTGSGGRVAAAGA